MVRQVFSVSSDERSARTDLVTNIEASPVPFTLSMSKGGV